MSLRLPPYPRFTYVHIYAGVKGERFVFLFAGEFHCSLHLLHSYSFAAVYWFCLLFCQFACQPLHNTYYLFYFLFGSFAFHFPFYFVCANFFRLLVSLPKWGVPPINSYFYFFYFHFHRTHSVDADGAWN